MIATLKYRFCPNRDAVMLTKVIDIVTSVMTCSAKRLMSPQWRAPQVQARSAC